jgi:hypothetical protein
MEQHGRASIARRDQRTLDELRHFLSACAVSHDPIGLFVHALAHRRPRR